MLILTRHEKQGIKIGEDCYVKIIDINGGRVRLGILAPKTIPVVRLELLEGMDETKAGQSNPTDVDQ